MTKNRKTKPRTTFVPKVVRDKQAESVKQLLEPEVSIIGIGGGGGSIVSEIAQKVTKASFIVVDREQQFSQELPQQIKRFRFTPLEASPVRDSKDRKKAQREQIFNGTSRSSFKNRTNKPLTGFSQNEKERIKNLFEGIDFCILVVCLGGKISSGALPIFAEISRKSKALTLGIFILPFEFEGEKKMEIAKSSLEKTTPDLNASVIFSNQKLFRITNKNTSLKEALSTANKQLARVLEGLMEMIYSSVGTVPGGGLSPIDFVALKTTLAGKGKLAFLNTIEDEASKPIQGIARKVLYNRLSPYLCWKAKRILFNIAGGENLSLNEIKQIGSIITNLVNPRDKVIFGITQNEKYEDKIKITLLATGCKWEELY